MVRYLLAFGALALSVLTLGLALPATREGRAEVLIAAPPERVAAVILDVIAQEEWRSGLGRIEVTSDGWREVTARGEIIAFTLTAPGPARIALTMASDRGWTGEWVALLTPEGGGTRIAVTERAMVRNPLARIAARLFFAPAAFAATYLAELKTRVETL
ncbi:MAG: SRPBCC family protein [Proteobacteria bacterium]|nr:SRPBCC family protein [Pseudomonadota bacterium]